MRYTGFRRAVVGSCAWLLVLATQLKAQSPDTGDQPPAPNLAASQEAIEMRYRRFEGTLQQLSEYLRKTDPARAELLLRAVGKSKEGRIPEQLNHLTDLLKKDQLGDAVERQEMVVAELQTLLELLMSEARKDDLDREKKRVQELIKDVNKLIGKETDARAETERGGNNQDLQNQQKQVADSTQKLLQKIHTQDAAKQQGKAGDKNSAEGEKPSSDKPNQDSNDADKPDSDKPQNPKEDKSTPNSEQGQPADKAPSPKPEDDKPGNESDKNNSNNENKSGDNDKKPNGSGKPDDKKPQQSGKGDSKNKPSQNGKPSESKPQKGKPQNGKPSDGKQDQPPQEGQSQEGEQNESPHNEQGPQKQPNKTAGRDEVERAKQEMDRAIEELKKKNRKGASDKQDKAIAELMKAKEKLEEILRQLREEERELVLAQMEARFRDMLLKQEMVNSGTLAIHSVDEAHRTDRHRNRSVELARSEDEIALLASKALTLLKEEGSSIAFPEAVQQIHDDMQTIARRLDRGDVGEITQSIEQDTVESLKEILEALQRELEKMKDKKQQSQQQRQEQQQQQAGLVNKLAEMKMLRSLQYRVNRRTKQLGRLVEGEQAVDPDIINQLKQLSDRQAKVQKTTYDLATGKNQ